MQCSTFSLLTPPWGLSGDSRIPALSEELLLENSETLLTEFSESLLLTILERFVLLETGEKFLTESEIELRYE
jgi:hypothetical protein